MLWAKSLSGMQPVAVLCKQKDPKVGILSIAQRSPIQEE